MTHYPTDKELDKLRKDGIIIPKDLPVGTTLYVTTPAQCYEITTLGGDGISLFGVGKRPLTEQKARFVGCLDNDGMLFAGMIVRDKHLIFKLESGRYTTGCVETACVKTDTYTYELWPQSEPI
jgi:hypothetical protein